LFTGFLSLIKKIKVVRIGENDMNCKINRNAAKVLKQMLESEEAEGKMVRV
jgi:hypothetical protein